MKLTLADIQFLFEQVSLPGNNPINGPFGNVPGAELLPLGIRDVQGVGNNPYNSNFGNADHFFPRATQASYISALTRGDFNPVTGTFASGAPVSYATRDVRILDNAPRVISNLVANQSAEALSAIGYTTAEQQRLAVLDNPNDTPGGRLNPLTGNMNPLPYSTFTALFGQFFDHGLDFVHKGADGSVYVNLDPTDPLYNAAPGSANFMVASRNNTTHVDISASSTDNLVLTELGLQEKRYTATDVNYSSSTDINGVTTAKVMGGVASVINGGNGGTLVLNNVAIDIANGSSTTAVLNAINAKTSETGITASIEAGNWVFSYTVGESINTVSPFIDLSQSYGSVASHTAFVREYTDADVITGRLVSGNGGLLDNGMATWTGIKANALRVGVVLHDKDVTDIPEVRLMASGEPFIGTGVQAGMWLVARHEVTGAIYYIKDSYIAGNGQGEVLNSAGALVTGQALTDALPNLILQTVGHAFLDDMAHGVLSGPMTAAGDLIDPALLNAHYIAGDGRVNENFGLTTIHDIFHAEHNRILIEIQDMVATLSPAEQAGWTPERYFQAAKLVTEMEYQHLVFGEFARKLSPHVGAFAGYDVTIDPAITAEFAHAVYRFGHSMLTETVSVVDVNGSDANTMSLIDAFLNPLAYGEANAGAIVAGDVVRGMSGQVANAIDEWVTGALRNNLVGLPLDLATLNIVRGRDAGIGSLNDVRADLFAQTGLSILKPYVSWDDFGQHLLHHESLENFIMAYADLTGFNGATLRDKAKSAMTNTNFMTTDQSFNNIDLWLGGLAEAKVTGGMLGSTFDFLFAKQMEDLQNGDRFYYLSRLVGTDLLVEIEGQLFSDIVMRNTDATHLYADIFSVADATVNAVTGKVTSVGADGLTHVTDLASAPTIAALELLDTAGWVGRVNGLGGTLYGNAGDYRDARGVLNPNGYGNASETLIGTDGAEKINGLGGNDTIWADGGNDTVEGGTGNDFLHGGLGDDVITDVDGDNFAWGEAGNDSIRGGIGIDNQFGGDGNDTIYGGSGGLGDIIEGGAGDDVIYGDDGIRTSLIVGNDGIVGIVKDSNGTADVIGAGEGNDTIYGGGGADAIDAGEGNDLIVGGLGADAMVGLGGNDIFEMDPTEYGVGIGGGNSLDGGLGFDTADFSRSARGIAISLVNINAFPPNIPAPVADIFLSVEHAIGSAFNDSISAVANVATNVGLVLDAFGVPVNSGTTLAPIYTAMDFHLEGLAGADTLTAGDGNDTLDGGTGIDSMTGGFGNDTYVVDAANDVIVEAVAAGTDTVKSSVSYSIANTPDLENITLTGVLNINATGNALGNIIIGNSGNNNLNGGAGADTMTGGAGNDTYTVDNAGDVVVELLNEGTDNVSSSASYTLGANLENLTLTGATNINGTGNGLANSITGNTGSNILDGGIGADTMTGGAGNDTYVVDNVGDVVVETNGTVNGVDTVMISTTYTLAANLENLTLTGVDHINGTGNAVANIIIGNAGNNSLSGGDGNDTLNGGTGVDTLNGGIGNDTFVFGSTAELGDLIQGFTTGQDKINLTGFDGNSTTNGVQQLSWIGTAAFTALGQMRLNGNTLEFNTTGNNNSDFVINFDANPNIVATDLIGVVNGVGSVITGTGTANALTGTVGSDTIDGAGGNDTITGGLGADSLIGGAGADRFRYTTVEEALGDIIADFKAGGADRIELTTIDANGAGAGNGTFSFIGTAAFSANATGQLRYAQMGGVTYIEGSTNADATAEFTLVLNNYTAPLVAGDFFL